MNLLADEIGIGLENVTKKFGSVVAVDSASFTIKKAEFMSLLGPSGCGKTTTLRAIAGFVTLDQGTIHAGGVEITHLPPFKRNIGLVFQNYALWPHMTIFDNISFGLKLRKLKLKDIKRKVDEVLSLTNLSGLEERFPREISGGQQQRVALARALVLQPSVLLLDEPLSNLDRKLRVHMRVELRQLQKNLGITTLYVTHDQEEALSMSDRVAVMDKGKIVQLATPNEIYESPQCSFVADFIGNINIMEGQITEVSDNLATFKTHEGFVIKVPLRERLALKDELILAIRPERIELSHELIEGNNVLSCEVKFVVYLGSFTRYHVELEGGHEIIIESRNPDLKLGIGDTVYVKINTSYCHFIRS